MRDGVGWGGSVPDCPELSPIVRGYIFFWGVPPRSADGQCGSVGVWSAFGQGRGNDTQSPATTRGHFIFLCIHTCVLADGHHWDEGHANLDRMHRMRKGRFNMSKQREQRGEAGLRGWKGDCLARRARSHCCARGGALSAAGDAWCWRACLYGLPLWIGTGQPSRRDEVSSGSPPQNLDLHAKKEFHATSPLVVCETQRLKLKRNI
jgi:hypothetical protein